MKPTQFRLSASDQFRGDPLQYGHLEAFRRLEIAKNLCDWANSRVLDLGCGNGAYTNKISHDTGCVVGIDLSRSHLSKFQKHFPDIPKHQARAESIPFADNSFDVVVCIETLEHVDDESGVLAEVWRVLSPGGSIVLTLPNRGWPFETHGFRGIPRSHLIPFGAWLPRRIHRRFANARIYSEKDARRILGSPKWSNVQVDWMLPPFDQINVREIRMPLQKVSRVLQNTWLRRFGVSLIVVAVKPVLKIDPHS